MDIEQFYPTPKELLEKIFKDTDWRTVSSILEPSAGNGDICDYMMDVADQYPYYNRSLDIDCIEINENRRATLKGKNYRVVYDDFLRFQTYKQYDLIAMNPPFADGERHLLKALEMQKNGGCIMCILNAETLRNPYTNERKLLVRKLEEVGAAVEYYQSAFTHAEIRTDVEVAVIKASIPQTEDVSYIFNQLRKSKKYEEKEAGYDHTDVAVNDIVEAIVKQCEMEMDAVPDGKMVSFLDGDKDNCDIGNLVLIDNAENLELARSGLRFDNAEFTRAGVAVAKARVAARRRKRGAA